MKTKTQHAAEMILSSLDSLSLCELRINGLDGEEIEDVRAEIDDLLRHPARLLAALAENLGVETGARWVKVKTYGDVVTATAGRPFSWRRKVRPGLYVYHACRDAEMMAFEEWDGDEDPGRKLRHLEVCRLPEDTP